MKPIEDTEKFVRRGKANVTTDSRMDRRALDDSFAAMDETIAAGRSSVAMMILRSGAMKVAAAAAAAIVIVALFIVGRVPRGPEPARVGQQAASAIEMVTAMSLERAYRQGGIEAVEDQCRRVFGTATHESGSPSILQLLDEQGANVKSFGGKNL